ncbi:hypothetical protein DFR36_101379 [Melaminivora alkalimesophila]|uniref:Uncharacterized protein n=1 Tax=Melaminivora alkalimesophila TaxID=1165852 RepID=A0A317RK89_9BURK|nr:hypothetical protein [Melaminivora alkalimesophila]PWW48870.1 hypothetical protein DFR36_101379 [Melaminivora alkalimesophila]
MSHPPSPSPTPANPSSPGWLGRLRAALARWRGGAAPPAGSPAAAPGDAHRAHRGEADEAITLPPAPGAPPVSLADNALAYRQDAAAHLYRLNGPRIYQGMLPPLLYAIGVLDVEIDARGQVVGLDWLRPPRHAPEVVLEIERTVRAAAPFPLPLRLGQVTYTDTWLWDESGKFQLDTLTEGQL